MRKRTSKTPKQNPAAKNPPQQAQSLDARREALARKLEAFVASEQLRACPRPACERRRACTREHACEAQRRRREATPEEWERMKAMLVRELARRAG
jgi:hypothetical protein